MTMLIGAFPDLRFTTVLMAAGNDLVGAIAKVSGTHQGEFMGIRPPGDLSWSAAPISAGSPMTG
jgi:predicted ester cyclase